MVSKFPRSRVQKIGVVIMTYGSATSEKNVPAYFEHIYPGKTSPELIADFSERYRRVGGSPLVRITMQQADALQKVLGRDYVVRAGMRHSAPFIDDALRECKTNGATSLVGIILAPQFSSLIMDGYTKDFQSAAKTHGLPMWHLIGPWPTQQHFISLIAKNVIEQLGRLGSDTTVVFTTHSLPLRVVQHDPTYLHQLQQTIDAVKSKLDPRVHTEHGYQSAGHTPEKWLTPDLTDILHTLCEERKKKVLIVPIQFLSDHLEILYDLDIAARTQCEDYGIQYNRIKLPNTDPLLIKALASLVRGAPK